MVAVAADLKSNRIPRPDATRARHTLTDKLGHTNGRLDSGLGNDDRTEIGQPERAVGRVE